MPSNAPVVSVLVAAYRALPTLPETLASLYAGGLQDFEVLVQPDDGDSAGYVALCSQFDDRCRVLPPTLRTGPGPARNRALAAARGRFVTLVDADDIVSEGYLRTLVDAARRTGAAAAVTEYFDDSGTRRVLRPVARERQNAEFFARLYGSLHVCAPRDAAPLFIDGTAEDVIWDACCALSQGGAIPTEAVYRLRLHANSLLASARSEEAIQQGYRDAMARAAAQLPAAQAAIAHTILSIRLATSLRYGQEALPGESYHAFVERVGLTDCAQQRHIVVLARGRKRVPHHGRRVGTARARNSAARP